MTDTFRALCSELIEAIDSETADWEDIEELKARARALLAQPVAEAEGLTDQEIEEWADACSEAPLEEMDPEVHGWRRCFTAKEFSETIRAALARYGRPTPQPVAVSERWPEFSDCDPQERVWAWNPVLDHWKLSRINRSYTHWLPANALPIPEATND